MSDYLDNLISRASGSALAVEPRPLSRFEPTAPRLGARLAAPEEAAESLDLEPPSARQMSQQPAPGAISEPLTGPLRSALPVPGAMIDRPDDSSRRDTPGRNASPLESPLAHPRQPAIVETTLERSRPAQPLGQAAIEPTAGQAATHDRRSSPTGVPAEDSAAARPKQARRQPGPRVESRARNDDTAPAPPPPGLPEQAGERVATQRRPSLEALPIPAPPQASRERMVERVRVEERQAQLRTASPAVEPAIRPTAQGHAQEPTAERALPREAGTAVRATSGEAPARRQAAPPTEALAPAGTPIGIVQPAIPASALVRPHTRLAATPAVPSPPDPAPTIQVTIGRVEVRTARQPDPAPRQTRGAPASMSLDEYLRQRNGGGAR